MFKVWHSGFLLTLGNALNGVEFLKTWVFITILEVSVVFLRSFSFSPLKTFHLLHVWGFHFRPSCVPTFSHQPDWLSLHCCDHRYQSDGAVGRTLIKALHLWRNYQVFFSPFISYRLTGLKKEVTNICQNTRYHLIYWLSRYLCYLSLNYGKNLLKKTPLNRILLKVRHTEMFSVLQNQLCHSTAASAVFSAVLSQISWEENKWHKIRFKLV